MAHMPSRQERVRVRRPWTTATAILTAAHHGFELSSGVGLVLQPELGLGFAGALWGTGIPVWIRLAAKGGDTKWDPLLAAWSGCVPGGRVRPFQPLAVAAQQAGNTDPYRGRGPQLLESSRIQRASPCLGSGVCPFDHSRGSPWSPTLGPRGTGHGAVVAAVGPAPFLVARTGGLDESGLVEPGRDLSQEHRPSSIALWGRSRSSIWTSLRVAPEPLPAAAPRVRTAVMKPALQIEGGPQLFHDLLDSDDLLLQSIDVATQGCDLIAERDGVDVYRSVGRHRCRSPSRTRSRSRSRTRRRSRRWDPTRVFRRSAAAPSVPLSGPGGESGGAPAGRGRCARRSSSALDFVETCEVGHALGPGPQLPDRLRTPEHEDGQDGEALCVQTETLVEHLAVPGGRAPSGRVDEAK